MAECRNKNLGLARPSFVNVALTKQVPPPPVLSTDIEHAVKRAGRETVHVIYHIPPALPFISTLALPSSPFIPALRLPLHLFLFPIPWRWTPSWWTCSILLFSCGPVRSFSRRRPRPTLTRFHRFDIRVRSGGRVRGYILQANRRYERHVRCGRIRCSRGIYAGVAEWLYLVTCFLSAIPFVLWYDSPVCLI